MTTTITGNPNAGWKTQLNLHDDNNKPTAASFAALFTPLLDNTAYLRARGIQDIKHAVSFTDGGAAETRGPAGQAGVWQDFPSTNGLDPYVTLNNCAAGDIVLAFAAGPFWKVNNSDARIRLRAIQNYGGTNTEAVFLGTEMRVDVDGMDLTPSPITLVGYRVLTVAGTCRVVLQGRNDTDDPDFKVGVPGGGRFLSILAVRLRLYP